MWRSSWTGRGSKGEAVDTTTTSGGDGGVRPCAWERDRGEEEHGESERGPEGLRGIVQTRRGGARQAGREEVAAACSCARRARALAYWREEEGDRRAPGGLGRQLGRPGGLHSR